MVQAAGFYNTLLQSDEPGLIVEVFSGYRLKEKLPDNIGEITLPVGVPEMLREGDGCDHCHVRRQLPLALEAAEWLAQVEH